MVKPKKAADTPPPPAEGEATPEMPAQAAAVPTGAFGVPEGDVYAELPGDLKREDPDAFRAKEEHIRTLFKNDHPGEALLRQESQDRAVVRYLRG